MLKQLIYWFKIACEKQNSIACSVAVARAFPLYSAKTGETNKSRTVTVTFLFSDELATTPNDDEVNCFNALAESVRLSAKITDMPCADMNTDDFLSV